MIAAWLNKHSLCGKSLPACGLGNRCIPQSHCQNPDDSVRFRNENSASLYLSLADNIQGNAQILRLYSSPLLFSKSASGYIRSLTCLHDLVEVYVEENKVLKFQCPLCYKELLSAFPCAVTLSQWIGDELILMYSPLHGSMVLTIYLWSFSIFPRKTLSSLALLHLLHRALRNTLGPRLSSTEDGDLGALTKLMPFCLLPSPLYHRSQTYCK